MLNTTIYTHNGLQPFLYLLVEQLRINTRLFYIMFNINKYLPYKLYSPMAVR